MRFLITKRAPYLKKSYLLNVTEKGVLEATPSDLYDTEITGFKIIKHDCISALKDFLGDYTLQERDCLYNILAHDLAHQELFQSVRFLSDINLTFAQLVNPILTLNPLEIESYLFDLFRELVENDRKKVKTGLKRKGCKLVMDTHHYLYFTLKEEYSGVD